MDNDAVYAALQEASRLHQSGNLTGAEACYRELLAKYPEDATCHHNLGVLAMQRGQGLEIALPHFRQAWQADPVNPQNGLSLLRALMMAGARQEAEGVHRQALQRGHRWPPLEQLFQNQQQPRDGGTALREALLLEEQRRFAEAAGLLAKAVAGSAANADHYLVLGRVLLQLNRFTESCAALQRGLAIAPKHAEMMVLLGKALKALDRDNEALAAFSEAAKLAPEQPETAQCLVQQLMSLHRYAEAGARAKAALGRHPDDSVLKNLLLQTLAQQGELAEVAALMRDQSLMDPSDLITASACLFYSNYLAEMGPGERRRAAQRWGERVAATARPYQRWLCDREPHSLRIGLVSGDFGAHPVGYFLENLLKHSRDLPLTFIGYTTVLRSDPVTVRLKALMQEWRVLSALSDQAAAEMIHSDGLQVLIDLSGHTGDSRLPVLAWRPAPTQLSWLGYFATTGLPTIDYFLADSVSVPADHQDQFTEPLWYLPETRLCFTPPDEAPPVSEAPCTARGYITFGSFQTMGKINNAVLDVWAEILRATPNAQLRVQNAALRDAEVAQELRMRLAQRGVTPERVQTQGPTPRSAYLAAHQDIDIILDTFPYPGGTTTCEALWMGVPTVTLSGETLIARQGTSMLSAAGLPDWVAETPADYVALACQKASDPMTLAQLRLDLRERVRTSPLFDGQLFAQRFCEAMWEIWRQRSATLTLSPES